MRVNCQSDDHARALLAVTRQCCLLSRSSSSDAATAMLRPWVTRGQRAPPTASGSCGGNATAAARNPGACQHSLANEGNERRRVAQQRRDALRRCLLQQANSGGPPVWLQRHVLAASGAAKYAHPRAQTVQNLHSLSDSSEVLQTPPVATVLPATGARATSTTTPRCAPTARAAMNAPSSHRSGAPAHRPRWSAQCSSTPAVPNGTS
jgi:hypothetical protein